MLSQTEFAEQVSLLRSAAAAATTDEEVREVTRRIAEITRRYRIEHGIGLPATPILQAQEIDQKYRSRPHLEYLSNRIVDAVREVERGRNQHLAISMPPRMGKTENLSIYTPLWMLRRHPEWKYVLASYDDSLSSGWAGTIRSIIEDNPSLGIAIKRDGGARADWATTEKGTMFAASVRGGLTGRGARVLIIDDPIKDFVDAHSAAMRKNLWNWWLSVAQTRLEPPYLVLVVMTRWHEDDFIGRLLSHDYEGDPREWQKISLPAIAEEEDALGREPGEPLISPILNETPDLAVERWSTVKTSVGTYTFSAMYQQRPAPAKGAIFDAGWWRFWTINPGSATDDERVVYLDPRTMVGARWVDSWDCNFESSDAQVDGWVVGQRWLRHQANRYLIEQQRGRWTFTQTIDKMLHWTEAETGSPYNHLVHERLIEKAANGAAIMDVFKEHVSGIVPVIASTSKEARARAITPEVESGNVFLPYPGDPGNEWVADLLSELRNFPHDVADDQVDALTQALSALRAEKTGRITVPSRTPAGRTWRVPQDYGRQALSDLTRPRY